MMEKAKTAALIVLVVLSLLQSYLLAYSMPGLGATVRSDQDYVNAEALGKTTSVESVIFPEELIIHMGEDKHTVIYPGTQFYEMILNQRIVGREFKGFQRSSASILNWEEIRKDAIGIELRFTSGISVELLQKLLKMEGDPLFLREKIDRIWIFKTPDTEEIRTFFFSSEEQVVYESVRADLTVRDVQDYVGFGTYLPQYRVTADDLYIPTEPIMATEIIFPYETYSPEQMQRLFFDSSTTRAFEDRSGSQIFTDGKRGLKVEQDGMWINYTNPAATISSDTPLSENVYASVDFINQHGGWDGTHRLVSSTPEQEKKYVTFRQYIEQYPVIDSLAFRYGHIRLTVQQGVVTEYARSLITLSTQSESRKPRWLQGGTRLEETLERYPRRDEVSSLFPALKAVLLENNRLQFVPVWVMKLMDGSEVVLLEAEQKEQPVEPNTEDGSQHAHSELQGQSQEGGNQGKQAGEGVRQGTSAGDGAGSGSAILPPKETEHNEESVDTGESDVPPDDPDGTENEELAENPEESVTGVDESDTVELLRARS
ncbi:two-component system activity regulator YycH [Paenibacillus paeoniae]|uniref:Regulatory protein YycH domain-containing protein n=1 Tax=Paenibacillus paeoniae TaxID=2292705 RepID=A0A371P7S6_9BACL|nr:two-component system activity regulator YycH [Paenibacillus paeoniae]REK71993.1 hypothetical protein DX130_20080 [Paenibacillus paeoniae]